MRYLVTGGAGFIGTHLVGKLLQNPEDQVCIVDKFTYAANQKQAQRFNEQANCRLETVDVCDHEALVRVFQSFQPETIFHLAAESHVDRSIANAAEFITTNIIGTYNLLQLSRELPGDIKFIHVSTDEVFGDLKPDERRFNEESMIKPSSPYSASKASSDLLALAWYRTYGLPVIVTNCSNNYGPFQYREKLIPLVIDKALRGEPIPVYGDGLQIRDWLYVEDHAEALIQIAKVGIAGNRYTIGGNYEVANIDIVESICQKLQTLKPKSAPGFYEGLISFVTDRPGHDRRYAIDNTKICNELGWQPHTDFETGLEKTVKWYINLYTSES